MWLQALYRNEQGPIQRQSSALLRKSFVFFIVLLFLSAMLVQLGCSGAASLAADPAPLIKNQPAGQVVTAGQTANFTVTADGTLPLLYQWRKNGTAISGAISSSYTTPPTTAADNGAQFVVTVSDKAGSVTSNPATLIVTAANMGPSFTSQPVGQTITAGQTATFSVTASGTAPLSYQWNKNGTAISGATSSSYTTPAETVSDNGAEFTVVVSNSVGNATSNAAILTVTAAPVAPSITTQPVSRTVTAGQTATFSVIASGTSPLSYQWNKNSSAISGATSSTYTTPATTSSDNGAQFMVTITNSAGAITSNPATLTVNTPPSITAQPASQIVIVGQSATFSVTATSIAPLSYQWQKNRAAISGATSSSYTTPGTTTADNGAQFTVVVSNSFGNATSNAAILTVTAAPVAPSITTQPVSRTVTAGQTATFSVIANGTSPLSYQWNKNGAAISGATSSTYTTPATTSSDNGAQFTVLVSNTAGSVTSSAATLTVNVATYLLSASPASLSFGNVNTGTSSTLPVTLTSSGNSNVTISNVGISGGFNATGVSAGTILTPGKTTTLNVTFAPAAIGSVTGSVTITSSATNSPTSIPLNGVGTPPAVTLAFPGAQGGGALSVGGRGGAVYLVSNMADSGAGSLRACIDASGPRTCVFRTGGTIALLSSLTVSNPFITIAGQTAPGGGIQISGPSGANAAGNPALLVRTHDVVVQYLRVRRGHNAGEICNGAPWSCGMSVEVLANQASDNPYNIMFDHVDAEWSNYDAFGLAGHPNAGTNQPRSITISDSIIGEEFAGAGQTTGAAVGGYSGLGSTAEDLEVDIDFHHNLFAGTSHRMPLTTIKSGRLVNNFIYGWTYYPMRGKGFRDIIGNYFKYRSAQGFVSHEIQAWTTNDGNDTSFAPSFYLIGNAGPSDPTGTNNWAMTGLAINESAGEGSSPLSAVYQSTSPIPTPLGYISITADPVSKISSPSGIFLNAGRAAPYDGVGASRELDCSGKWVDARDPIDNRIVSAVVNGTTLYGSYDYSSLSASPQSQADLGSWPTLAAGAACVDSNNNGLPDVWESYWGGVLGLGSTLNPNGFDFGDGYTNLEHYFDGMSPSP